MNSETFNEKKSPANKNKLFIVNDSQLDTFVRPRRHPCRYLYLKSFRIDGKRYHAHIEIIVRHPHRFRSDNDEYAIHNETILIDTSATQSLIPSRSTVSGKSAQSSDGRSPELQLPSTASAASSKRAEIHARYKTKASLRKTLTGFTNPGSIEGRTPGSGNCWRRENINRKHSEYYQNLPWKSLSYL